MMKVVLKQLMAGPSGVFGPGSMVEMENAAAKHLIETRQAVQYEEPKPKREPKTKPESKTDEDEGDE